MQGQSAIFSTSIAAAVGALLFACIASSSAPAEPETSVAGATDGRTQYVAAATGNTSFVAWMLTSKPTLMIFGL